MNVLITIREGIPIEYYYPRNDGVTGANMTMTSDVVAATIPEREANPMSETFTYTGEYSFVMHGRAWRVKARFVTVLEAPTKRTAREMNQL